MNIGFRRMVKVNTEKYNYKERTALLSMSVKQTATLSLLHAVKPH